MDRRIDHVVTQAAVGRRQQGERDVGPDVERWGSRRRG
jgi:hypothetical protein